MAAVHVSKEDFEEKVLKSDKPVLVDFYADWCGPCKMAAPVLDELSEEQDNVMIAKVNVDENQELAQGYGVMSIPTVVLFNKGEEENRKIGFAGKAGYEEILQDHLN